MPISDLFLTSLANGLGALAVLLIVVYQFVEVNAKRAAEAQSALRGEGGKEGVARTGGDGEEGVVIG